MKRIKQVSQRSYEFAKESGWGEFECANGYGIFVSEYPTDYGMIEGDHFEVIGEMDGDEGFWTLDSDAAKHAEENYGYKIIRDIEGIEHVFIDTPENRVKIMNQIKKGERVLMFDVEDEDEVWHLTLDKLLNGIKLAIENGYWDGQTNNLDGEVGDIIFQYALFDEIVFG